MTFPSAECGHANRDGARFCAECGAELARACHSCGATLSPSARFCDACGAAAPDRVDGGAAPEARKVLTVVFADLAGSTALQEQLDAESVRRVMTRFYEQMRAVLEAHGGVLEKFIGDAVVALFGRPVVQEDDALRAVRAATAMVAGLESLNAELERVWGVRLRMRTGVNTGELVVSDAGAVVGDAMNTAARLEQAAPEGEVLIGEATWRLVRHVVELHEVQPLMAKGKSAAVRAWTVLSVPPADWRRTAALDAPLVGRQGELTRLRTAFDGVLAARACRLVTVVGSPGVGKSRLAREFGDGAAEEALVVEGHCEPTGEGVTFLPVAEILRAVAGIGEADPAELVREKLAALVPEDDPDRDRLVERSAGVLGVVEPASVQETFWALRRGVEFLARERALVLVLDDLHWGQPLLLDLVEHLVEWVRDAPVLLVALARPELRDAREALMSGRRAVDVIELEPLDERESLELVDGLLGEVRVPPAVRARILEVTGGNPLFLGETLRMLVDEGALLREGDVWVPADGLDAVEVPPTIQALLAARIERLRADERSVVERASVIGKQFYRGAVAELVAPPVAAGIDGHLEALRRKDMVEPEGTYWIDEPVYRFHHVLIRDAAYRSLLKEARSELHERFADWLQAKAGDLVGEHEEVIAFHLEQAHEYRRELGPLDDRGRALGMRAAERLWSAGRRALAREDLAAAANLLSRALARDAGDEVALLWDLCDAVLSSGDTAAAAGFVARYAAAAADEGGLAARAAVLQGQLANLTGAADVGASVTALVAAADGLAEANDREGEARAHQVAAGAYARLGQVGAVEEALDRALATARAAGDRRRTTAVLAAAPRAALWGPSPVVRASGRCLDVVRILRMTPGNRHVEAIALRCQAVLEAMRGRVQAAREILAACRTTLEELGLAFELNETAVHAGIVELLAGEPVAACEQLRTARDGFEALGAAAGAAQAAALLARALVTVNDSDALAEAIEQSEFAEAHSGEDLKTVIIWTSARAQALGRSGDIDRALTLAQRATTLADPTDALADKGDAALALADVLLAAGRDGHAREVAKSAAGWYEAKGHTVGAERARQLADTAAPHTSTTSRPAVASPRPAVRSVLGDRPPERYYAEWTRRWDAGDLDALLELYAPDWVLVEHRALAAMNDVLGPGDRRPLFDSILDATPDARFEIGEVLACDERVIALDATWRGSARDGGGSVEVNLGIVTVIDDGLEQRMEVFEPGDRVSLIACYAELDGGQGALGERPPERWWKRIALAVAARDRTSLGDLWDEGYEFVDHRAIGWEDTVGHGAALERWDGIWEGSRDVRLEVQEVLACDERTIALRIDWRGSGRSESGGGEFVVSVCVVALIDSGRAVRWEQFEPEDRGAALARFGELSGRPQAVLVDRPPERHVREWMRRWEAGDLAAVLSMHADHWVLRDHRGVRTMEEQRGLDEARSLFESLRALSPDIRLEIDEVLACDDRVIAYRHAWRGTATDGGGSFEAAAGFVTVIEDGLERSVDQYDAEDRAAMIARYVELGGGLMPLSERPPERWFRRLAAIHATRDRELLPHLYAEDYRFNDHRLVGWEPSTCRREAAARIESIWDAGATDVHLEVHEVLACADHAIALQLTWEGGASPEVGGGRFAFPLCAVVSLDGDEAKCWDQYEPEDRDAALARFAELTEGSGRNSRPRSERVNIAITERYNAHDLAGLMRCYAPDVTAIDHRRLGWGPLRGADQVEALYRSIFQTSPDARWELPEILASDEDTIAVVLMIRGTASDGSGELECPFGYVTKLRGDRVVSSEFYEAEDRAAMIARYAELGGGQGPLGDRVPERHLAKVVRAWARRDPDALLALQHPAFVRRDHRALGMEELRGRDAIRRAIESVLATSPDLHFEVDDVLACDERVIAARVAWRGAAHDGGGEAESAVGIVDVVQDGLSVSRDQYAYDDADAMWARFAELNGEPPLSGGRRSEQLTAEFVRRYNSRDLDAILELYRPDFTLTDHRSVGWDTVSDLDRYRESLSSGLSMSQDMRYEVDEIVACDERVIAFRAAWRGTAADGGGTAEVAVAIVTANDGALIISTDVYEPDDRRAMIARFAELGGGQRPLGNSEPERWCSSYVRCVASYDLDALADRYAEDWVFNDHRTLGWETVHGVAGVVELQRSGYDTTLDLRAEIDEVLACGDRVIAFRMRFVGHSIEGGGAFEISAGWVMEIVDGRARSSDMYEPEDREAILARYAELAGSRSAFGDRAPERFHAEWVRRYDARDLDAVLELYVEDWVSVDHRQLGSEEIRGLDACRNLHESVLAVSPDIRHAYDEVLACDERVIAVRVGWRGHLQAGGGEADSLMGLVTVVEGGREVRTDVYEYEDDLAMIARYAELGGGQGPLGDRPPEQYLASWIQAHAARDMDRLAQLTAEPTVVDHRSLGWEQVLGEKHASSAVRSGWEVTAFFHLEVDEVLACDDRVIAARIAWRGSMLAGGGGFEIPSGLVARVESGQAVSWDLYEPDDREAMLGRFAELSARREPPGRVPERYYEEWIRRWDAHDLDGVIELYAEDWIMSDHRSLKMVEDHRGRAQARVLLASIRAMSDDLRFEIDEVLACDERVLAARIAWRGTARDGGGQVEVLTGFVSVIEDGHQQRLDQYDFEDRQGMIARYAELGGGQAALGDRPPERFWAEFCRRWATLDPDATAELYAEDCAAIEHRPLGWTDMHGRAAAREQVRSTGRIASAFRFEIREVLACDDRVIALVTRAVGTSSDSGGPFEIAYGCVCVIDNGVITRLERFDADDRDGITARFAELRKGSTDS